MDVDCVLIGLFREIGFPRPTTVVVALYAPLEVARARERGLSCYTGYMCARGGRLMYIVSRASLPSPHAEQRMQLGAAFIYRGRILFPLAPRPLFIAISPRFHCSFIYIDIQILHCNVARAPPFLY